MEYIEFELKELENVFALMVLGSMVGLPTPPTPVAAKILPHMERELRVMLERSDGMCLGEIASIFDI